MLVDSFLTSSSNANNPSLFAQIIPISDFVTAPGCSTPLFKNSPSTYQPASEPEAILIINNLFFLNTNN